MLMIVLAKEKGSGEITQALVLSVDDSSFPLYP